MDIAEDPTHLQESEKQNNKRKICTNVNRFPSSFIPIEGNN